MATNATGTPLSRVNGTTRPATPCNTGFSTTSFTSVTTFSTTLPAVEVTVRANTGYVLNVTGFSIGLRRSASGPANVRLAYSTDGGTTWTNQGTDQSPNNASCGTTTTGTWTTSFTVAATNTLKFRAYGFNATSTSGTEQIMNLTINGSVTGSGSSCGIPSGLSSSAITTTSALLSWSAVTGATSYSIQYRPVGATSWSTTTSGTTSVTLSGLLAATSYEFQVEAICAGGPGGYSSSAAFTTLTGAVASGSSGKMAIYFNTPVNNTVSSGVNAVYLANHMADTLVAYISRAKYSIDIAQYDYNQSSGYANIANAVNAAYASGKRVRWIYDGSQPNTGLALLNSGIQKLASPTSSAYGIMHDKFVIIDAKSANPNDAIVSTGSEDWGVTQFNSAPNNILFIQDSALAHAYLNEFNMMWGDTGITPNASLAKFGPFKTDLGAHIFNIGGKTVELYFSPSDNTDGHIQSAINSANTDLYFGVYSFTMSSDANAIAARHTSGVYTAGIVDQYSNTGAAYPILTSALGSSLKTYSSSSVVYHNKMVIVDPSNNCSDPLVLTGSHNWTYAANTKNDENTLIIHNDTVANIYYQSFYANYTALSGTLTSIANCTPTTCDVAVGLTATSITTTSALLTWTAVTGATSYTIQYRPVGTSTWSSTTSASTSVTVISLTPGTAYEFQVSTVCSSGTSAFSSSQTFTTLSLPCSVPTGITVTGLSPTSVTVSWLAVSGAVSYNIQYRIVGTGTWSPTTSATNSVTITGLTPGANYEFQVEVVCATGTSGYSSSVTFTTASVICGAPSGLNVTGVGTTTATLNWSAVTGAVSYGIVYRMVGTTAWSYTTSTTTSVAISGLVAGTTYQFKVQSYCAAADSSDYTSYALFTTTPTAYVVNNGMTGEHNLNIFPDPTAGAITIQYSLLTATDVSVSVYNMVGQEIRVTANELQLSGDHKYNVSLPAAGIYFVRVLIDGHSTTRRVVRL